MYCICSFISSYNIGYHIEEKFVKLTLFEHLEKESFAN